MDAHPSVGYIVDWINRKIARECGMTYYGGYFYIPARVWTKKEIDEITKLQTTKNSHKDDSKYDFENGKLTLIHPPHENTKTEVDPDSIQ